MLRTRQMQHFCSLPSATCPPAPTSSHVAVCSGSVACTSHPGSLGLPNNCAALPATPAGQPGSSSYYTCHLIVPLPTNMVQSRPNHNYSRCQDQSVSQIATTSLHIWSCQICSRKKDYIHALCSQVLRLTSLHPAG